MDTDAFDRALLAELRRDGRATFEALGQAVGLSRPAVTARMRRLLDSDLVTIVGVVHPSVFGLNAYAHLGLIVQGPIAPVAERLAEFGDLPFLSAVAGRFSLIAELRCTDQAALAATIRRIAGLPGVRKVETGIYTEIRKDTHFPPGRYDETPVDDVDRGLLAHLRRDGRASFAELADGVGLSTSAARTRVLRLLESGAVHVGARVNASAWGAPVLTGFEVTLGGDPASVVSVLDGLDRVQYLATAVGRADVICTAVTYDADETLRLLEDVRALPGVLGLESWTHLRVLKEQY
ncbi:Lrp/AsnC family transcriptional regulator [Cryptosporangium aurantiacum]|uniref:Transcriptional regulator, AsnC family n=1 Tax=Cryptosporangium aurantiacum TaxID=134849 RepID=A0A1M7PUK2_9ACTN|nr:Lrp/AsnC family transcriptional regulator [Cryptosporangium aurantiacum]SHN21221.1 transcriptional regulator, AsnC family [Cryptosporangium aurantiacum]